MSESSSARLQASKEWLQARKAAATGRTPIIDVTDSVTPLEPPGAAEPHGAAYRAAAECQRLHQTEADKIDAELTARRTGKFRRGSLFKAPPKNNVDRNYVARLWFVAKMVEQKSWNCRAKGKHGGSIGVVGIEVFRTLLYVIKKVDGRLYPSLETIAVLSRKSKQAVCQALKVLEHMGFLTIHKRVKRVQTPYGARVVQDSNAYEFHLPAKGLGALAMAVFCPRPSESTKLDASKHHGEKLAQIDNGGAVKELGSEVVDRWWLADPLQTGNGGWR